MHATWMDTGEPISLATLHNEGVFYEQMPESPEARQVELDRIKALHGYIHQDEVELSPDTPGLDAICAKFIEEHLHTEDEVRFVLSGEGLFDIRSQDDRFMRVQVSPGDLITVPARRNHRFALTESRTIRCVRLFQDPAGWEPIYRER